MLDELKKIEQASMDLTWFTRSAIRANIAEDRATQLESVISIAAQIEVLKMRLAAIRANKDFQELDVDDERCQHPGGKQ